MSVLKDLDEYITFDVYSILHYAIAQYKYNTTSKYMNSIPRSTL